MTSRSRLDLPRWVLAIAPLCVLGVAVALLTAVVPLGELAAGDAATAADIAWILTGIGALAGIVPVAIGMLWFPILRDLENRYIHAFLALSAGVIAFIGLEMSGEIVSHVDQVETTSVALGVAVVGAAVTFAGMYGVSQWRQRTVGDAEKSGLRIAYLVAIALGLHSMGEGLAIGTAFVDGNGRLVTLLVVGFVMHNVMEGPIVVSAIARDTDTPPLRHFAAIGLLAGGPVIVGGWLGSLAETPLLTVACYAVAVGAIGQVLVELGDFVRFDAGTIVTRTNVATFAVGFTLTFFLEDALMTALRGGLVAT